MVRGSRAEGDVPSLANRKQRRGSIEWIKKGRATRATKREASVNARLIEEAEGQLRQTGKISR